MSNYNEGARGRARYWMERAQRAEAECERLREHIRGVLALERSRDGWTVGDVMNKLHAALATPPPDVDPDDHDAGRPPFDDPTRDEIQPEQAHGDALADWVQRELNRATRQYRHNTDTSTNMFSPAQGFVNAYDPAVIDPLIRHLTASGVPEEVRRLPEDWMQQAGQARRCLNDGKSAVYESCARQLDKALASAPADGYKLVPVEPTPKMVDATWDHDKDETESHNTRNHRIWSAMIAASPSDAE